MAAAKAIPALAQDIEACRKSLYNMRFKGSRYFLDQAVFRYLWGAVASAEVILLAAQARHAAGTESLKRHLHECLLDLAYILSDPDPELCAAKTILADLDDWRQLWALHEQTSRSSVSQPIPEVPPDWRHILSRSASDVAGDLDKLNARLGGAEDLFARALGELQAQGHWHWSGKSRHDMIQTLTARGQLDDISASTARALVKLHNLGTHASPAWSTLAFEVKGDEETHVFPDPRKSTERDIEQLCSQTASLLRGAHEFARSSGVTFRA